MLPMATSSLRCQFHPSRAVKADRAPLPDGRYKEAVNECTSALDVQPNNQKALLRRAKALEAMGLYKQALSDVQKVNKLDDAPPENQVRILDWSVPAARSPGGHVVLLTGNRVGTRDAIQSGYWHP